MITFTSGNSGNCLAAAVVKIGPGCQQEGAFCQYLTPTVAPQVYAIIPDGYVMEQLHQLQPEERDPDLLRHIERILSDRVWNRPALPISTDISWQENLSVYGVLAPDWAVVTKPSLVHGDPTVSNALKRSTLFVGLDNLVMADPRPPRDFIPQNRETDMGRILQSYYGWEFAAYGWITPNYERPIFMYDPELNRAAHFWCGAAAARIEHLETNRGTQPRRRIIEWCRRVRGLCNV